LVARKAPTIWYPTGFAAAAALLLALAPLPAGAQILDPQAPTPSQPQHARPPSEPLADPDAAAAEEEQNAFSDGRWGANVHVTAPYDLTPGESAPPTPAFVAGQETSESWDATTEEEEPADVLGAEQAALKRAPPPQDGDLVPVGEPIEVTGGAIELSEPYAQVSGEGVTLADLRSPSEIRAFSGSDAGYDPLLLEAQETNPVFSNFPLLGFGYDPYAPLGTRIGSFTLFSGVEADGDYNSNLFASPEALGDTSLEVRPAMRLASNWSTHALEVRASGDLSFHDKYPSEDDRAYLVEGLGRLDVTRFTNLQGYVAHEEAQESRSAINATSIGTRPDIVVNRARAALNHRFNRLTVQLRGAVLDTRYGNDVVDGMVQSNADRDYTLYEEAVRPKWEFNPNLFLFGDFSVNNRNYSIAAFTDGINRTSSGERYRVGVSFGDTSQVVRGDVSLGYGRQTPNSPQLVVIDGLLLDGNLTWRVSGVTTLLLTATTDVAETTTADSGGVLEHQYAGVLRHNFTTELVGTAGVSYYTRNFVGADLFENQFTAATGLEYFLNRHAVLFGRYQHTAFNTTSFEGNWTGEEVQLGIRLRD
jgi:hypothetical protein